LSQFRKMVTEPLDLFEFLALLFLGIFCVIEILHASRAVHSDSLEPAIREWTNAYMLPCRGNDQAADPLQLGFVLDSLACVVNVIKGLRGAAASPPPLAAASFFDRLPRLFNVKDRLVLSH